MLGRAEEFGVWLKKLKSFTNQWGRQSGCNGKKWGALIGAFQQTEDLDVVLATDRS